MPYFPLLDNGNSDLYAQLPLLENYNSSLYALPAPVRKW